jgi:hypothetical protein
VMLLLAIVARRMVWTSETPMAATPASIATQELQP